MTCEEARDLIGPYGDDDLPTEARRRIESHVMRCTTCAWDAQTLRITRERLREHTAGEVVASDAFRSRLLARLRADNPHLTVGVGEESADTSAPYQLPMPFDTRA